MLGFVFGTCLGWPAMAQPQLQAANETSRPLAGEPISNQTMSWLAGVLCLGCVVGTFVFGALADRVGRKKAGLAGALPYVASWLCIIFADEVGADNGGGLSTKGIYPRFCRIQLLPSPISGARPRFTSGSGE